ncbi:MAG: hypothetical protein IJC50_06825 [Clostridia bacterium]|nr:hypothetical protein [Clostridia bacterium]
MNSYIIRGISLPYNEDPAEAENIALKRLKSVGVRPTECKIYRRSVDARKKKDIRFVYSVLCRTADKPLSEQKLKKIDAVAEKSGIPAPVFGNELLSASPVICGFGPAGMFCALLLAENGYAPVVCERGPCVKQRQERIERFFKTGMLDSEANVQFGAGGAGTFSDGKLMTRINDGFCRYVLEKLCEFGAPEDVLVNARPHIGTDLLGSVVEKIDERITALGGRVLYDTRIDSFNCDSAGRIKSVVTNNGDIACGALILAFGHSARDTYTYLKTTDVGVTPKTISVGMRIEHLRSDIDAALYGDAAGDPVLGPAEYNLSANIGGRGVYTFCMCPGGQVVAAASEQGGTVTNGASAFARDLDNSNAAVAVSLDHPEPMEFQRMLERRAFELAGGNFAAPISTFGDFLAGKCGTEPGRVKPSYTRNATALCDLHKLFPEEISRVLAEGICSFGKKISGFDSPDAVLTAPETRTSAPYRIPRGDGLFALGHDNLYPCGEGAGWAGGITSAAVDGIRVAMKIMERFKK